jgi:hypothetical protein
MVDEIAAADVVHPLAQAGVELPKPKEPIVADPEGIKGMDSAQQPTLFCVACVCRSACLRLCSAGGFRVPRCHVVPAFLYGWLKETRFLTSSPTGPSVDRQSPAMLGSLRDQDFQLSFTPKYFCAHIIAMSRQMKVDDRCADPEIGDLDIVQERWQSRSNE